MIHFKYGKPTPADTERNLRSKEQSADRSTNPYGLVPANAGIEAKIAAMLKLAPVTIQRIIIMRRLRMTNSSYI